MAPVPGAGVGARAGVEPWFVAGLELWFMAGLEPRFTAGLAQGYSQRWGWPQAPRAAPVRCHGAAGAGAVRPVGSITPARQGKSHRQRQGPHVPPTAGRGSVVSASPDTP